MGLLCLLGVQLSKGNQTSIETSLRLGSQGPIGSHRESVSMDVPCLADDIHMVVPSKAGETPVKPIAVWANQSQIIVSMFLSFRQKVECPGLSKRRFCAFDWPKRRSACLGLSSFWRNDRSVHSTAPE